MVRMALQMCIHATESGILRNGFAVHFVEMMMDICQLSSKGLFFNMN